MDQHCNQCPTNRPHSIGTHMLQTYTPQELRICGWMLQHSMRCYHITILTLHLLLRDRCIDRYPAQNASPAVFAAEGPSASQVQRANYVKKVAIFYGNKPPAGQKSRPWEEYLSEFIQNAEIYGLPPSRYRKMVELLLSLEVREQWMQAKANMSCDSWEGMNQYMRTHFAILNKSSLQHAIVWQSHTLLGIPESRKPLSAAARFTQLLDTRACSEHTDTFVKRQALGLLTRLGSLEGWQGGCHACVVSLASDRSP